MPAQRLSMRKIKEVLRLKWESGLSNRQIAKSCAVGRPTVAEHLRRAIVAGLSWPLPQEMDERTLESKLFASSRAVPAQERAVPEWAEVHRELKRKGVTLFLLWQEHKATHPQGYHYSWFCQQYRTWRQKVDLVMRQEHRAGEKLFVDYAGQSVPVHDPVSGTTHPAHIFVAVLGASSYTYVEAAWSQGLPEWIGAQVRAFSFFGSN